MRGSQVPKTSSQPECFDPKPFLRRRLLLSVGPAPDEVARHIDATTKSGSGAATTRRKGAFQTSTLSDLVDLIGFAHWLAYACLALVLSLVATTTVMSVQDRIQEHAVLQTS